MVQTTKLQIRESGQLRRVKMHASCLIEKIKDNYMLTYPPTVIQTELHGMRFVFPQKTGNTVPYLTQDEVAAQDDDLN